MFELIVLLFQQSDFVVFLLELFFHALDLTLFVDGRLWGTWGDDAAHVFSWIKMVIIRLVECFGCVLFIEMYNFLNAIVIEKL